MNLSKRMLLGSVALSFILITSCFLFLDGYYLPFKACRPLLYNTDQPIGEGQSVNVTSETMMNVVSFYDQHLKPKSNSTFENGVWRKIDSTANFVTYACSSTDINMMTAETGCVYITKESNGTKIVTELTRAEGSSVPCQGP